MTIASSPSASSTHATGSRFSSLRLNNQLRILSWITWPLALFTFLHKTFVVPSTNHPTDDFSTVWDALHRFRDGVPVYSENYATVDPHYLYSPGATALLSPISLAPSPTIGRDLYILANSLSIVAALAILLMLFRLSLRGPALPIAIFLLFNTEAVRNTLLFANINGFLLLLEVLFFWMLLRQRPVLAGAAMGIAILIKPQFLPLLLIPLVMRHWWTIAVALGLPAVLNALAWPFMEQPEGYFHNLLPYLGQVRDYANSSLSGVGVYYGFSDATVLIWRILGAFAVLAAVVFLLPWRKDHPLTWMTTTAAALLLGVFLVSSLGQMYYSIFLTPLLFTVVNRVSVMHNPVAWFGVYFCMSIDTWHSDRWQWWGKTFEYTRGTIGWSALLLAISITAALWWWQNRSADTRAE